MMAAMPMMMPSMVRNDRSLWLHTPCSARLIFSNIVTASLPAVQGIHGGFLRFGSGHHVPAIGEGHIVLLRQAATDLGVAVPHHLTGLNPALLQLAVLPTAMT